MRLSLALMPLLLAGVVLLGPAAAGGSAVPGGSIVYVKAGNVWVSSPDGSRAVRLTRDGTRADPYIAPSQADNGTVVALYGEDSVSSRTRGNQLRRIARNGRQLGRPVTVASGLKTTFPLKELAFSVSVSPNGRKVALHKALFEGVYRQAAPQHGLRLLAVTVEYRTAAGRTIGRRHAAGTELHHPKWVDNRRVLVFAPYNMAGPQVFFDEPGGNLVGWFGDQLDGPTLLDRKYLADGELTRAGDLLAVVRGTNVSNDWRSASIQIYRVTGTGTGSLPQPACSFKARSGPLARPTWSPDGSSLAWQERSGIYVSRIDPGRPGCGIAPRLIARGGTAPDWGPAPPVRR